MNTKSIYTVSKYLLLLLLILTGFACSDKEETEDTSIPVLISQNIHEGDIVGPNGYVELVFSKAMRQASDTEIYFNGKVVRISINYEKVRYTFSKMENKECTFEIPAGALTDMKGREYNEDFFLNFKAKSEVSGGGKVFDAIVDSKGNGDYTTIQKAIDAAAFNMTEPYRIFITNGTYNECIIVRKNKSYIYLIGESRDGVKIQYAMNRLQTSTDDGYKYSVYNSESVACKAGYTSEQEAVAVIQANNFYAENISFINLYGALQNRYVGGLGKNGQADALMFREDRSALHNCKLVSYQDTWWCRYPTNNTTYRAYANNCWIEGQTDYVYGSGNVLIENSTFYNVGSGSVIVAGSNYAGTEWGFIMKDCIIDGEAAANGTFAFGRPWQNEPKTIWINTKLNIDIRDGHWTDMGVLPKLYAEYNTTNSKGENISIAEKIKSSYKVNNVETSYIGDKVLSEEKAATYTYNNIVKGSDAWDPKSYMGTPLKTPDNVSLQGKTLTWDAISDAAGYLIFMNGNYVGQTTDTTVTLTNTDAENIYTVKTVSQHGTVSE